MHPTAPLRLPHESSKDCVVSGYNIPHGTMLFVNVCGLYKMIQTLYKEIFKEI
ncbi:putative unspecific monooxygenase [Helianthus annuus]|uniref:Unspecific monooxygenase n=1 Tax=Helianthus annuus TaxID=4232 RepID=A0A9K3JB93_HELAN|nr:putative unspecific monooxygenase [Helianthus annuus]KAJ0582401.1 putative unspecific monooxygenase [Helianthus annuus]KAJ0590622.1 putative unspecific monooxygenase [Helianthus annuus]KAJ0598382.1 putative unspecific monooxygenase [Helianthus annuus]KAJ0762644.1 putative unspecific monooxygenase [Helianthus annuus]